MSEPITTQDVKNILIGFRGQTITLEKLRSELQIYRGDKSFDTVRNIVFQLAEQHVLTYISRGNYKVIQPVERVNVYGLKRERRPMYPLVFPRDFETGEEMDFAQYIGVREGDLIVIGGVKSKGKTALMMNFCAENIDKSPVLLGNEYTVIGEDGKPEPSPRWLSRMDFMSQHIDWTDENGDDRFELLPVAKDYVEHIKKNRMNLIDWINLDGGKLYDIGTLLEALKAGIGRGILISALQKSAYSDNARGGQFVKDFADVLLLLDGFGENPDDVMLTVEEVKEKTAPIMGRKYAYRIEGSGTQIVNFRELKKCPTCNGTKNIKGSPCYVCDGTGWVNKGDMEF